MVASPGPAISLPVFRGGALRADYRGAEAEHALAVAQYDAAVTQAPREVADAVASRRALDQRLAATREAASRVARDRYAGGLATYLDVLTAGDALIAARRASLETRAFAIDVALVRAFSGGFRA